MRQISRIALVAAVAVAVLSTTEVRAQADATSPDQPEQPPQTEAPTAPAVPDAAITPDEPEQPPQTEAPTAPAVPDAILTPDEPEQPPQTEAPTAPAVIDATLTPPACPNCSFSPDEPEQAPRTDSPTAPAVTDATGASSAPSPTLATAKPVHGCMTCEQVSASICLAGSYFAALLSNSAMRAALLKAIKKDLCRLLSIASANLTITDTSMTSQGLVIMYQVVAGDHTSAEQVRSTAASLSTNGAALSDTTQMYSGATGNSNVTVSDSSAADSSDPRASSAWRLSGVVVAVFTVALGAFAL